MVEEANDQFKRLAALSAGLAILVGFIGLLVCGISLGLFAFPFFVVAIIVPFISGEQTTRAGRLLVVYCVTAGFAIVWLVSIFKSDITLRQWSLCSVELLAFSFACAGLTRLVRVPGVVVLVTLAWLTWPVWATGVLQSKNYELLTSWFVPGHPLFAVNAIVSQLGIWTEMQIAYWNLTVLGQDASYALPSPMPAILLHSLLGIPLLFPGKKKLQPSKN